MIKIYNINDKLLMQAEVTSAAKREQEMSKSDYISLSFSAAEKVILPVSAYINYTYKIDKVREVTRKFLLLESYEPIQTDECSWKYTPQFQHPKMILSKTPFFIYTRNSQNVEVKQNVWSFVGTTSALAEKIKDFLNKDLMFGECGWKVIFQKVTANTVNVSFSDNDFISALTAITNAIGDNCEWHIDYDDEIIYIGKVLVGATPVVLEVGKNVGVPNISNSKESYYNAFSIFGGTRNITQVNSKGENVSSGNIRLQLDKGNGTITIDGKECSYSIDKYSTLDLRVDKIKEPLFTKVLDFSQIFPSLNTYVYNVRGRVKYVLDENNEKIPISYNTDGSVKEYKTFTVWYMRLAYPTTEKVEGKTIINTTVDDGVTHYWYDFEVTDDLLINGKNIGCSFEPNFNTGALSTPLAGRGTYGDYVGFELTYHKEASSSHSSDDVSKDNFSVLAGDYEIIYQEDNEVIIPTNAAEMLIPRGESMPSLKCNITVLYNIAMADTIYYEDAQNRLLEKAKEEIVRLLSDMNNYEVKSYSDVFLEDNPQLQIGQNVTYKDGHGYELATRVLKLSTNIDFGFVQTITLGNQVIKGTITQLKEDVQTIIASGGSSGNGGGYSVSQLRSLIAKYGSDNFLSKQFDDTAHGTITWEKIQKLLSGLLVGNSNSENGGSWTPDTEGRSHLITDYLEVRMKAIFEELVVKKTSTIGGKEIVSPAGGVVAHKVEEVTVTYNNVSQKAYRCYFLAEQEGDAVDNDFAIGDQVRSESFNVQKGTYHKVGNHFYWRLVIGRDEEPVELEGKKYHYIDLSDTDCATASDVPAKGDVLNQCGNRTDVDRQNCLIFSAVDTYSPSVSLYHGINSYSFANKEYVEYGVNKQTNKAFFNVYGDMYVGDRPTKENGYEGSSYIKYDSAAKQVSIKGKLSAKSTVDGKELSQYIKENSAGGLTEEQVNNLIKNSQVITDLQNQVDGAIETWFYDGVPTLKNAPASSWTTDKEKNTHLGDLYYDNKTGKAYRFAKDGNTYKWTIITDTDIAKALSDASKAQETADGKMKVFSTQPIPPYQLGDIWVNATYPTDGSIYKNEILRCQTAKAKGSSFAIADWTKASKYTDDSALNTFKEEYKNDMASYKEQLDEKVETWFYNYAPTTQNKPASDWTTDTLKSQHAGDLFYNTSNGYTYRWTGTAWVRIKDNDINTAMTAASKAQDTADGKRTVFTSQPTVPYDEGDLWASGGDDGKTLMVCIKGRTTGSFTSSEWVKANDSDLNAFAKTIEESLTGIQDQLDKKAETWYQSIDPSASWTTDDAKKEHKGDLWYNTSNNQTFFWNGTKWDKQDVPTEVFDKIDGKSSIYVSKPASYEERDLWILEAAYTLGGVAYSKGELVVATKSNASFSAADWTKKVKYTDDTVANAAKKAAEEAKKAADTAQTNVTNLGKTVTSNKKAFDNYVTDGYLEPSEIAAMAQDSKRLEDAFAAAEKSYTEVKEAAVLKDTKELTDLNTAFDTLSTAKTELIKYLSDISARYNAANTEGKANIVSAVGTKFTNFQSAYSAFYDKLGLANAYITSKIYGDLKQNITDLAGYKYIKDALGQTTDIDGGLVMTTLLALRDADGNVQSGINGAIDQNRGKKSIATWWGGRMVDKDYNSGSLTPATSLIRFDGSGYLANGAIWWDVDGKVHADPTSFIISEKNLGAYLTFFEPTWKAGSDGSSIKDLVALTPQAPFKTLSVSNDLSVEGKLKIGSITLSVVNGALKIDGNVYSTGGMSAYGEGTSNGGGLNGSIVPFDKAKSLTAQNEGTEIASAWSIKKLYDMINSIDVTGQLTDYLKKTEASTLYQPKGNYLTSHQDISGKSDKTHTHSVKINGVTKTIAATGGTAVDLGTYLTSHQSLAAYLKSADAEKTYSKLGHTHAFSEITGKPTTLAGYGVTDGVNAVSVTGNGNAVTSASIDGHTLTLTKGSTFSLSGHTHTFASLTSKPTTIAGYGITDAYTKAQVDSTIAKYLPLAGGTITGALTVNGIATFKSKVAIGDIYIINDGSGNLYVQKTDGKTAANFYATGGITAYGAGTSTSGGGGLNGSVKSYADALKLASESLSEIASAYSIKQLSTRITSLEGGSATSISVSGGGNAVTSVTKNGTTISVVKGSTFLTSHQSLSAYLKTENANNTFLKLSGGTISNDLIVNGSIKSTKLYLPSIGDGYIVSGVKDTNGSDFASVNCILKNWNSLGISSYDDIIRIVFNSRAGDIYLRGKLSAASLSGNLSWSYITDRPSSYTPSAHTHKWTEITDRPSSLKNPSALSWSGYSSGSYDGSAAKSISIPNNTNQLTNGAGFITASASITGNAATATKLVTARNIALGHDFRGSANFDGSGNITINGHINSASIKLSSTDPNPFKRIAHVQTANSYNDNALLLYLSQGYIGGNVGICRVEFRTNNVTETGSAGVNVRWLVRYGYATDSVQVGYYSAKGNSYMDVFVKTTGGYQGTVIRCLQDSRGDINSNVSLFAATQTTEAYTSIEAAATALYNLAYTSIVNGSDVGTVNYANSAGNSDTLDGIHANGLFTNLSNSGNNLSITIGGTHKTLTVKYAASAGNADTLDGVHASGLFTNLSNSGNNISITIGGTNKTLTAAYATNCDTVDGYHAQSRSSKPYGKIPVIGTDGVIELGHYIDFHHDNTTGSDYSVRLQTNGNHSNVVTLPTATGTLALTSDNVASATKLQTTRTLWGQSFNGTANISGSMTGVGDMTLDAGARIKHGSGNLYIGNSDNSNWIGVQDICSQSSIGDGNWSLRTSGAAHFKDTTINGTATIKNLLSLVDGSHKGLKMGSTYISSLDGEVILQGNTALRFGNDAWDYNQWAGLKYDHSIKTVYLGIADGSIFKANSAQSGGVINLKQGISSVYTPTLYAGGDIFHTGAYRMLWKNSKASKYLNVMNISQDDNGILTIGYGNFSNNKNVVLEGYNLNFRVGNDSGMKSMWLNYNNGNSALSLDGNFYATGGVTAYKSSDERLKHDIHGVDSLAIIKAMGGTVAFRYNADNKDSIGWIAQRVLHNTFMQDLVEKDDKGFLKINYWSPKLIAVAFGAIEQVDDEVSRLKARVVFLESEVQRLSGKQDGNNKKRLDNKNINLLN